MEIQPKRKEIFSWSLYDFANSAYASLIPVLLFPLFYKSVILGNSPNADLWWGIAVGLSILLSGLLSPVIGALADLTQRRKILFILSSLSAIIGTAIFAFTSNLLPLIATIIFILTNMVFNIALNLYDSLLFNVSSQKTSGNVSNFAWGIGYAGGILATLLVYPLLRLGETSSYFKFSFIVVALFYLIFSLPAFFNIKEITITKEKIKNPVRSSFKNIFNTLKNWRQYKYLLVFLLAFYFLTEGIVTLTYFISLYSSTTLNLAANKIAIIFIIGQLVAVPTTIITGKISNKVEYKKILIFTLFLLIISTILLGLAKGIGMLYIVAILTGLVLGGSQATARAWYNNIIPFEKRSELFGFNSLASKISATIGPALFGVISVTINQRIAVFFTVIYFVLSLIFFANVKNVKEEI